MGALSERMNSGIGPARPVHSNLLPRDLEKGGLEPVLDGVAARLALPAGEACAVVSDDEL